MTLASAYCAEPFDIKVVMPATGTVLLALDSESRVKLSTDVLEVPVDEFCVVTLT